MTLDGQPRAEPDDPEDLSWDEQLREAGQALIEALPNQPGLPVPETELIAVAADAVRLAADGHDPWVGWALSAMDIARYDDDQELLEALVATTMVPPEDLDLPDADVDALLVLEPADWVGIVLGLSEAGPGASCEADTLVELADADVDPPSTPEDRAVLRRAFTRVLEVWQRAGIVEATRRGLCLTLLGATVVPRAARRSFGVEAIAVDDEAGELPPDPDPRTPPSVVDAELDGPSDGAPGDDDDVLTTPDGPAVSDPGMAEDIATIARAHHLDARSTEALVYAHTLALTLEQQPGLALDAEAAQSLLDLLGEDLAVVVALAELLLGTAAGRTARLARLIDEVRPVARGRAVGVLGLLEAELAEARGDAVVAEQALRRALQALPDEAVIHEQFAWYLEDRGDVRGAVGHLRRGRVADHDPDLRRLDGRLSAMSGVGRNDPCPCGSEAKYKRCCERTGGPLAARVPLLLAKAETFVRRSRHRVWLLPLLEVRAGDASDALVLQSAHRDGVVIDAALFEAGLLDAFLAERGPLLPHDECTLAASWREARPGIYEVRRTLPEQLLLLRTDDGTQLEVTLPRPMLPAAAGSLVVARLLPDGAGLRASAMPVLVPPHRRAALADALNAGLGAAHLCAWLSALEDRPAHRTVDGEPTVLCTARIPLEDADAAAEVLAARFHPDLARQRFAAIEALDGRRWVVGTLVLRDGVVEVQACTERRFAALLDELARVPGSGPVVAEQRLDLAELAGRDQEG